MIITIIGWTATAASLIVPRFIGDKQRARIIGASLSAFACGLFLAAMLIKGFRV
jgi:hypothetical protein